MYVAVWKEFNLHRNIAFYISRKFGSTLRKKSVVKRKKFRKVTNMVQPKTLRNILTLVIFLMLLATVYFVINKEPVISSIMRYKHGSNYSDGMNEIRIYAMHNHFMDYLSAYKMAIGKERSTILYARNARSWQALKSPITVISARDKNFYEKLKKQNLTTIFLMCGQKESAAHSKLNIKLLVQQYYEWTASKPLCEAIWNSTGRSHFRDRLNNGTCDKKTNNNVKLESIYFRHNHFKQFNTIEHDVDLQRANGLKMVTAQMDVIFYVHLVEDAVITPIGDVFSQSLNLVPFTCSERTSTALPKGINSSHVYKEVFIISQFWGNGFFHFMLEDVPRLIPYIEFLKANPNIKIHVPEYSKQHFISPILRFLTIDPKRIVWGQVKSKLVYLPQGTQCGRPHVQQTQLLSKLLRNITRVRFNQKDRNSLVLIQRSGIRKFRFADEIIELLKRAATMFGYRFELFPDNPLRTLNETARMFNRAAMIVAPHGAGLSNMLFSEPGTYVIEGICNPHINLCYQWTAHILGHRYHAVPSRHGCPEVVDIEPEVIERVVKHRLEMMNQIKTKN